MRGGRAQTRYPWEDLGRLLAVQTFEAELVGTKRKTIARRLSVDQRYLARLQESGKRARLFVVASDAHRGRLEVVGQQPAPRRRHADGRDPALADTARGGRAVLSKVDGREPSVVRSIAGTGGRARTGPTSEGVRELGPGARVAWGAYQPAIERHELVVGRRAPSPVDDERRLSPVFVEWMQMIPEGWVTDILPRTKALKCLGNGVVPLQAATAIRHLHDRALQGIAA